MNKKAIGITLAVTANRGGVASMNVPRQTITIASFVAVLFLASAGVAPASDEGYLTAGYATCEFQESRGGGLVSIAVGLVRYPHACTESVTFRVGTGNGFTGVYVGETSEWPYVGNAEDGIWLGFHSGIIATDIHLVTVQYMTYGTSSPCSWLRIEPYPDFGAVWIDDCNTEMAYDVTEESARHKFWFNGVVTNCLACSPLPVGTEPSTWGRVKALYR